MQRDITCNWRTCNTCGTSLTSSQPHSVSVSVSIITHAIHADHLHLPERREGSTRGMQQAAACLNLFLCTMFILSGCQLYKLVTAFNSIHTYSLTSTHSLTLTHTLKIATADLTEQVCVLSHLFHCQHLSKNGFATQLLQSNLFSLQSLS